MTLQILQVNKLSLHRTVGSRSRESIFLSPRMRHCAVVIRAVGSPLGRAISWRFVDAAIGSDGAVGDVRRLVESGRVEGFQG